MAETLKIELFCKQCPGVIEVEITHRYGDCHKALVNESLKRPFVCSSCGATFSGSVYAWEIEAEVFNWARLRVRSEPTKSLNP